MSQSPPGLLEARAKAAMEGGGKAKVGGQGDHGHPGVWLRAVSGCRAQEADESLSRAWAGRRRLPSDRV